jgi:DDE superfamily endonuclease/Helix-turn-helix of DDE superfamily endonuclease
MKNNGRKALNHYVMTGIPGVSVLRLAEELAPSWETRRHDHAVALRASTPRVRQPGAGRPYTLEFIDRLLITLVALRLQLPHQFLAAIYGVDRSTITRAVHEVRPLLAQRGLLPRTGPRLHTLMDAFAYAHATGETLRVDGTEVQVRRPVASRPGRRAFVSGKKKQNTMKATVITDSRQRVLWVGNVRPGRMHDQTAIKSEGILAGLAAFPDVKVLVDAGYRGLAKQFPDQVIAPPLKGPKEADQDDVAQREAERFTQSSARIVVEQAIGEMKHFRPLQRFIGRRDQFPEVIAAIAGLVSDRNHCEEAA